MITPNPVISKIKNNVLSLISYRMSSDIARILGGDLFKTKKEENQVQSLILADNDLRCNEDERSLDYIL